MRSPMPYALLLAAVCCLSAGCKTPYASQGAPRALLKLSVTPAQAHIYIDDAYQGRIDHWRDQTLRLEPGMRRVELQAKGYITHRMEIELRAHEEVTFTYALEPVFDRVEPLPEKER